MRLFKPFVPTSLCIALIWFSFSFGAATPAFAKDLAGRLGVGFTNDFSNSSATREVPALSAKYGISKDIHVLGAFGVNTLSPAAITIGGKVFKNIFFETNLNFFSSLGFAYLKDTKSGIELLGTLGAEFFIPGIDSLGLLFEFGASASNVSGSFVIKTVGYTFINAGMHFYF